MERTRTIPTDATRVNHDLRICLPLRVRLGKVRFANDSFGTPTDIHDDRMVLYETPHIRAVREMRSGGVGGPNVEFDVR